MRVSPLTSGPMQRLVAGTIALALAIPVGSPTRAIADDQPDYFGSQKAADTIVVRKSRSRSRNAKLLIGGLAGGAAIAAGVGVYFHLRSRGIANDLSSDMPTNRRWSDELAADYDRGQRAGTIAIVSYVAAGLLAGGTVVAVWRTDPGEEVIDVPLSKPRPTASVVPGGGVVGAAWGF